MDGHKESLVRISSQTVASCFDYIISRLKTLADTWLYHFRETNCPTVFSKTPATLCFSKPYVTFYHATRELYVYISHIVRPIQAPLYSRMDFLGVEKQFLAALATFNAESAES